MKIELPYDPAILLLGIYLRELKAKAPYLYLHVHSNIIHNSQMWEAIQMSIHGWMDKQNTVYTCHGNIIQS